MNKHKLNQSGFTHIIIFVLAVVIAIVIGVFIALKNSHRQDTVYTNENAVALAAVSPVKIKSLPLAIDKYNAATGMAGDIKFVKESFSQGTPDMIMMGYGFQVPALDGSQGKTNPQPTFLAPAGTKVHALIDGKVVAIPTLYSKDFSIHMQGKGSQLIFETEHVMNVTVKVGDQVKAGDVIAEVSTYDAKNIAGLGLVEIGVLQAGSDNPPTHLCTFDFLDDSIKAATLGKITQLETDWETFRGKTDLYGKEPIAGCLTHDVISDNNNSQTGKTNE